MRASLAIAASLLTAQLLAQPRMPASTLLALEGVRTLAEQQTDPRKLADTARDRYPVAYMNGRCMVGFLGKASSDAPLMPDAHIVWGARAGAVVSFHVDAHHLDRLDALTGVTYAQLAGTRRRMLDKVVHDMHADSAQQGINLPQTYTGRNVIVGIVDAGFDYTHPMFYDTAMIATRILAAWDPNKLSGPPPMGYTYGTVYEGAAELLAAQGDTIDALGIRDYHGTHVAGIAGGGGAGTPYRGVAFDAEYLFASLGNSDAQILDAFVWMRDRAQSEGKRLVVNCSWGGRFGPLDGTDLLDQAMDALSDQGVLFVCANGNYGDVPCHIKRVFSGDTLRTRVAFPTSTYPLYAGQSLLLWSESGAPFGASIAFTNTANTVLAATPWYQTATGPAYTDSMLVSGNDTIHFTVSYEAAHPLNGRPFMRFIARRTSTVVKLALRITAPGGTVHAWNDESFVGGGALGGTAFQGSWPGWTAGDQQYTVIDPACAHSAIGAGAYKAEGDGSGGFLAGYSSRGPTMDERLKPDIAAPGVDVVSSINSFTTISYDEVTTVNFNGQDYPFGTLGGTSMAAPATSGCAALLLEAAPFATPAEMKEALLNNARTDNFTGAIPPQGSTAWGMGKVNAYHAVVDLLGVAGMDEALGNAVLVWPNPTEDALSVALDAVPDHARYALLDLTGRMVKHGRLTASLQTINLRPLPPGAYLLRITNAGRSAVRHIVKQ